MVAHSAAQKMKRTSLWDLIIRCRTLYLKKVEMKKEVRIQTAIAVKIGMIRVTSLKKIAGSSDFLYKASL
jgi:hypothetical protein